MTKVLVTGATGFVGRRLVSALITEGHEVRCAVSQKIDWLKAEQVVVNRLDCDPDWSEALEGIDVVIHLAARAHVMKETSSSGLDEYRKINSIATQHLAKEAAKHQVKRFIFLSSIKVNGESTPENDPFTEESVAKPVDPYGQSKLHAEQYLEAISQETGMQVVILRSPLVYGPGVKANFLKMMKLVKKDLPLPFGDVKNSRHIVYVDNLVSALCLVLTHPDAGNQTYLVADDEPLSLTQLLSLLGKEMNTKARLIPVPVPFMEFSFKLLGLKNLNIRLFRSLEVSNSKIKSQLGWAPPVSCTEGLRETVKWYERESNS